MQSVRNYFLMLVLTAVGSLAIAGCSMSQNRPDEDNNAGTQLIKTDKLPKNQATAVFAMGCFWCAESDFEKVDGVIDVISGYTGGTAKNPTYKQVTFTETGHYEAVLVTYDTKKLAYSDLLEVFWKNIDPYDATGQFCDKGSSYRAAIFPGNKKESKAAKASKEHWASVLESKLAPAIIERSDFFAAEDYHQDYYKKNPQRYNYYRTGCRRDARLEAVWGEIKTKIPAAK